MIPTPLGAEGLDAIPQQVITRIHQLEVFIVERGKTARQFLKATQTPIPLQQMTFFELNKHTTAEEWQQFLKPALEQGKDIGLLSEAGCPGVADPGAVIAQLAHKKGIRVIPMVGPSSILLALMASGLNGQQFAFHGYLPVKNPDRKQSIKQLERQSSRQHQSQVFIETPYRNVALFNDLLATLQAQTRLCIATDLSLPTEQILTQTIQKWKQGPVPDLHKRPSIFMFLAN